MMFIILYTLWADIGYNIVLFSAGIEGVPKEFDEAAAIDGREQSGDSCPLSCRSWAEHLPLWR